MDQSPLLTPQPTLDANHSHCLILTDLLSKPKNNYHTINFEHTKIQLLS